jgi:hypothetical protein
MSEWCPRCGGLKEPPVRSGSKRTYCKACAATYARARNASNPEYARAVRARWRSRNPDKVLASNRKFYGTNREQQKARAAAHRAANPEMHKAATIAWRAANKERFAAMQRAWREANLEREQASRRADYENGGERERFMAREWKRRNPHLVLAANAQRQAVKRGAMPPWADVKAIEGFYAVARALSVQTGTPHHVDHIVPLQSRWVCGLHCEANLRVIPGAENQSKSNRRWPDMPAYLGVDG